MYLFGDPGKPYGYGRFGAQDDVSWCADDLPVQTYVEEPLISVVPCED